MALCCDVNPIKTCKSCNKGFCSDHVYTEPDSYSWIRNAPLPKSECHKCYDENVRTPWVKLPKKGMGAKEFYSAVRRACPTGYINITINIQDGQPGASLPNVKWQLYHEKIGRFEGETPELIMVSFLAKIAGESEPRETPASNIDV